MAENVRRTRVIVDGDAGEQTAKFSVRSAHGGKVWAIALGAKTAPISVYNAEKGVTVAISPAVSLTGTGTFAALTPGDYSVTTSAALAAGEYILLAE